VSLPYFSLTLPANGSQLPSMKSQFMTYSFCLGKSGAKDVYRPSAREIHEETNRPPEEGCAHPQWGFVTLSKTGRGFVGIRNGSHATVTTSRQVCMAEALKARCVFAEIRWRWTLKVLWAAA
jgi:hypothetical protein